MSAVAKQSRGKADLELNVDEGIRLTTAGRPPITCGALPLVLVLVVVALMAIPSITPTASGASSHARTPTSASPLKRGFAPPPTGSYPTQGRQAVSPVGLGDGVGSSASPRLPGTLLGVGAGGSSQDSAHRGTPSMGDTRLIGGAGENGQASRPIPSSFGSKGTGAGAGSPGNVSGGAPSKNGTTFGNGSYQQTDVTYGGVSALTSSGFDAIDFNGPEGGAGSGKATDQPPDVQVATSEYYVLEQVNSALAVFDKTGKLLSVANIFGSTGNALTPFPNLASDPCDQSLTFDPIWNHFVDVAMQSCSGRYIWIATSVDGNPLDGWLGAFYFKDTTPNDYPCNNPYSVDQPRVGTSGNMLVVSLDEIAPHDTCGFFGGFNGWDGTFLLTWDTQNGGGIYSGFNPNDFSYWFYDTSWGHFHAVQSDAPFSTDGYFVAQNMGQGIGGPQFGLVDIAGIPGHGASQTPYTVGIQGYYCLTSWIIGCYDIAGQKDSSDFIDMGDQRIVSAVLTEEGTLWAEWIESCNPAPGVYTSCVHFIEYDVNNKGLFDDFYTQFFTGSNSWQNAMYPSFAADQYSDVIGVVGITSPSLDPSD